MNSMFCIWVVVAIVLFFIYIATQQEFPSATLTLIVTVWPILFITLTILTFLDILFPIHNHHSILS